MVDTYLSEVVDNERLSENVHALTIVSDGLAASSRAGQFVHIKCGRALLLRRPISICSVRGDAIELVVEVKGEGTFLLSRCSPGERLDVLGPLGNGFRIPDGNIIVVGGGIGSPPMLFTAESAAGGVTAILGFRNRESILLKDEFEGVCDKVYITTDDGSFGIAGFVTAPLLKLFEHGGYDAVLACGPRAMLSAVGALCGRFGVPCQVSLEENMGCGVGACLVCVCATLSEGNKKMSRVCIDGPVFDAAEVVW